MNIKYYFRETIDFVLLFFFWYFFTINIGSLFAESWLQAILFAVSFIFIFVMAGVYKTGWEYMNLYHLEVLFSLSCGTVFLYSYANFHFSWQTSWETLIAALALAFLLLLNRILWYFKLNPEHIKKKTGEKSVFIYGAGSVTMHLLQELTASDIIGRYHIAAILDNDEKKIGSRIGPYKIEDGKNIKQLVDRYGASEIWLTMPAGAIDLEEVIDTLRDNSILYKVVPRKFEHIMPDIRSLRIEDLIQRPEIRLSPEPLKELFSGKRVMVTGAAGSIGSEIARQIISLGASRIVLLDQSEHGIYEWDKEILANKRAECHIADIGNRQRIMEIVQSEKPQIIFHAAAYKHVPLMEKNFKEAIYTNIIGTYNLLYCATEYLKQAGEHAEIKFVNISTDKAVSPENTMGLTKRISELIVYNMYRRFKGKGGRFEAVSVRFGNVLSSSGSVVPLFWEQIQKGGPLTITHKEMERFFMTIPEAVNLVLHAVSVSKGDDILALDMGKPVKILGLAERLILLSGHMPYKEIGIEFVGIRPGEKLKEEVFWTKNSVPTQNPYIYRSSNELAKINIDKLIRDIQTILPEQRSLTWWKSYLKQYENPQ